jgi:hypothetical protein
MKAFIALVIITLLSGCATGSLSWVANHYDRNDICQTKEFAENGARLKPAGYQPADGCGGSRVTTSVIRDNTGRQLGIITNR